MGESKQSNNGGGVVSSAEAVLVGALAPGVNGPTWNTLKFAFFLLGMALTAMLSLAFLSSDLGLILHVTLLVLITGSLFFLLSRFLAETGFVSVENQMQEIGLTQRSDHDSIKTKNS